MKIMITNPVCVDDKHGIRIGRVFEVIGDKDYYKINGCQSRRGVWVRGDTGNEVLILPGEYKVIEYS